MTSCPVGQKGHCFLVTVFLANVRETKIFEEFGVVRFMAIDKLPTGFNCGVRFFNKNVRKARELLT